MDQAVERIVPTQPLPAARFAGFWRRVGALGVDIAVLGLLGLPVGLVLGERLAPAGSPGRLIGLLIILPYLGVLGSRVGGGQTMGKRLLGIRVVDAGGQPLSLPRSIARAAMLGLPWILNGLQWNSSVPVAMAMAWVGGLLVFGVGGAILGTVLLNRPTRQALHDLVVGSYVVRADGLGLPVPGESTRRPLVASVAWVGVVAVASAVMAVKVSGLPSFRPALLESLSAIPGTLSYQLHDLTTWRAGGTSRAIRTVIWFRGPPEDAREAGRQAAAAILQQHPGADAAQSVIVTVIRGWDVGVFQLTRADHYVQTPAQWRAELGP